MAEPDQAKPKLKRKFSDEEQERRFQSRINDPMRRWKLSPMDLKARELWVEYSKAKDAMFAHADVEEAPWYVVEPDDKRRARLNCVAHLLSMIPYGSSGIRRSPAAPRLRSPSARGSRRSSRAKSCTAAK